MGVAIIGIAVIVFSRLQAEIEEKYKREPMPEKIEQLGSELTDEK
ncbi:MAG TPA: hypothetical protein VKK79_13600 [Candidatus Lokiarchaeia archaeon]|nr:hypothetical protein [Candidatus Lokiarchaeia archaeon]